MKSLSQCARAAKKTPTKHWTSSGWRLRARQKASFYCYIVIPLFEYCVENSRSAQWSYRGRTGKLKWLKVLKQLLSEERLRKLRFPWLERRRLREAMIKVYKLIAAEIKLNVDLNIQITHYNRSEKWNDTSRRFVWVFFVWFKPKWNLLLQRVVETRRCQHVQKESGQIHGQEVQKWLPKWLHKSVLLASQMWQLWLLGEQERKTAGPDRGPWSLLTESPPSAVGNSALGWMGHGSDGVGHFVCQLLYRAGQKPFWAAQMEVLVML